MGESLMCCCCCCRSTSHSCGCNCGNSGGATTLPSFPDLNGATTASGYPVYVSIPVFLTGSSENGSSGGCGCGCRG